VAHCKTHAIFGRARISWLDRLYVSPVSTASCWPLCTQLLSTRAGWRSLNASNAPLVERCFLCLQHVKKLWRCLTTAAIAGAAKTTDIELAAESTCGGVAASNYTAIVLTILTNFRYGTDFSSGHFTLVHIFCMPQLAPQRLRLKLRLLLC
jgi:hypothetical protein